MLKNIGLALAVIASFCWGSWYETHYTRKAIVTNIVNNVVTVVDATDNEWQFEKEGFSINDEVELYMNTMNTNSNIYDDVIEDAKKYSKK